MSSAASVMLKVDKMREDKLEYEAWKEYQAMLEEQQEEASKWGGIGGIIGAAAGFFLGGPVGMIAGYGAGQSVGTAAARWDDYDEAERFLTKEVFEGGKFDKTEMHEYVDEAREWNKEMQDSIMTTLMTDALITAVSVGSAGGFMAEAEKQAWKSLSFGDKLNVAFTGAPGEAGKRATDTAAATAEHEALWGVNEGMYGATADVTPGTMVDTFGNVVTPSGSMLTDAALTGKDLWTAAKGIGKGIFVPGSDIGGIQSIQQMNLAKSGAISIEDLIKLRDYGFDKGAIKNIIPGKRKSKKG